MPLPGVLNLNPCCPPPGAIAEARQSVRSGGAALRLGYGPFSGDVAVRIAEALGAERSELSVRLEQEETPDSLRRVAVGELAGAVVMQSRRPRGVTAFAWKR